MEEENVKSKKQRCFKTKKEKNIKGREGVLGRSQHAYSERDRSGTPCVGLFLQRQEDPEAGIQKIVDCKNQCRHAE
jgi:hypothetical protein